MLRYNHVTNKNNREIVLLKGYPCIWGKCAFCDYIDDNSQNEQEILQINSHVLKNITGEYGVLEVINSGSVFELPQATLEEIKRIAYNKNIHRLCFESYYAYRKRLDEIRTFFNKEIIFKCGIETFDHKFRNQVLKKGIVFDHPADVSKYFDSVCLLAGIKGQTKEMIDKDIDIMLTYFPYGCINLYTNNTTTIKADEDLQEWFKSTYTYLEEYPNIDILWNNIEFGVGGNSI